MKRLVREAVRELRHELQGRSVEFIVDEIPPSKADRALLKQVLLNLLANAIKFTRPCHHAEIRVGFVTAEVGNVYFVQDNGVGFNMEFAESIFAPFHRLNKRQDFEGTGIGLALVRRIVDHHGGRIWAESQPGVLTTFYFHIN
jgi:signal transduction histidine kinase